MNKKLTKMRRCRRSHRSRSTFIVGSGHSRSDSVHWQRTRRRTNVFVQTELFSFIKPLKLGLANEQLSSFCILSRQAEREHGMRRVRTMRYSFNFSTLFKMVQMAWSYLKSPQSSVSFCSSLGWYTDWFIRCIMDWVIDWDMWLDEPPERYILKLHKPSKDQPMTDWIMAGCIDWAMMLLL